MPDMTPDGIIIYVGAASRYVGLKELLDDLRSDWWSALVLGVMAFLLLSPLLVVPLYVGPVLLVSLAPYASARIALRDQGRRRAALGAALGAIEGVILVVAVNAAATLLIGPVHISALEGLLAVAAVGLCTLFGALGAASLETAIAG